LKQTAESLSVGQSRSNTADFVLEREDGQRFRENALALAEQEG
jgi:hypothetical protein